MNTRLLLARVVLAFAMFAAPALVHAADAAADLKTLVDQIQAKLRGGQRSAADLAPDLAAFDALLAKYKDEKTEDVARIALMRAALYIQVLDDVKQGTAMLAQLQKDFPGTPSAASAERMVAQAEQMEKSKAAKTAVVGQPAPALNFTWSSREGLKNLAELKGKVVVLDFWATWCGPCIASFPQVRELVAHYADAPVVVLGVTSLQGRVSNLEATPIDTRGNPEKETGLMPAFIKAKNMTWPVAFSAEPVFNPDYGISGIPHMTIIAPDGTVRYNGLHPAIPLAEKTAKIDALLKEFALTTSAPGR